MNKSEEKLPMCVMLTPENPTGLQTRKRLSQRCANGKNRLTLIRQPIYSHENLGSHRKSECGLRKSLLNFSEN
jgi:hypothetical protein